MCVKPHVAPLNCLLTNPSTTSFDGLLAAPPLSAMCWAPSLAELQKMDRQMQTSGDVEY